MSTTILGLPRNEKLKTHKHSAKGPKTCPTCLKLRNVIAKLNQIASNELN